MIELLNDFELKVITFELKVSLMPSCNWVTQYCLTRNYIEHVTFI